jgi:hypothetical protein
MATKEVITYTSDLSGVDITDNDAPTIYFTWDGTPYEIDLTSKEADKFYNAVKPYVDAARKHKTTQTSRSSRSTAARSNAAEIRAWAKSNGMDVPDRGRIPQEVRDAWDAR